MSQMEIEIPLVIFQSYDLSILMSYYCYIPPLGHISWNDVIQYLKKNVVKLNKKLITYISCCIEFILAIIMISLDFL